MHNPVNNRAKNHRFFGFFDKFNKHNKRCLSAEGFLLLPSALRPRLLGVLSVFLIPLFFFLAAETFWLTDEVSAASLTLTIPNNFSLNITPGASGVFAKSSNNVNIKTDNESGYTLSIKAKNSDNGNALLSGNNKLNSISEQTDEDNFRSDTKFNNSWGYLPSKFNNLDNTNFLPGPTSEESILETTEEANNESGVNYSITIGAKVDNTISSGNYSNDFVFSVTANAPKYDAIMQDWDGCGDLPDGGNTTIRLLDKRDNNVYKVAKLKDGKCWMVENLRLGDDKLQNRTLTSSDTDIISNTYQLVGRTDVNLNANNNYDIDALYIDSVHPEYGGYYSWHTATAGTGTSSMSQQGQNATSSICPKGWKLPTGGADSNFNNLVIAYGGNNATGSENIRTNPVPGFVYSGLVWNNGNGLDYQESYGHFWSSTNYNASRAYLLNIRSSNVLPSDFSNKYSGRSVRCVINEDKTMQAVSEWGGDVKEDEVVEALDIRDGNTYKVSKLKDGKLWMVEELRLGDSKLLDRTLTPSNTDIASTFTLPSSDCNASSYPDGAGSGALKYCNLADTTNNSNGYGNYYSWYVATASSGTTVQASGETQYSICPKGWRLPTRAESNTLISKYDKTTIRQSPVNLTLAGLCSGASGYGCPNLQNSLGGRWTSTVYDTNAPYYLRLDTNQPSVQTNWGKGTGFSVRCIAREF